MFFQKNRITKHGSLKALCFLSVFLLTGFFSLSMAADTTTAISCLGRIVAGDRMIVVSAPEGSIIGALSVKRGDIVMRGAELARLRDYDIQAAAVECAEKEIALARAGLALIRLGERPDQLEAQRAVVTTRETSLRMHQSRRDRYQKLHEKDIASDDIYETVLNDYATAEAELTREKNILDGMLSGHREEIAQAEARVALAEAYLRREMALLEAQLIRAPIEGQVLSINAYPGESVEEGGILELADTQNMMIVAEVYETDVSRLRTGKRARIRSTVFEGEMGGTVVEIEKKIDVGRIYALDPLSHSDQRIVMVRVKPDSSEPLSCFSNAQVTVVIDGQ